MNINGEFNMFDRAQAKSSNYELLSTIPVMRGTIIYKYVQTLTTPSHINILNFLHDGEGELELTVGSPFMATSGEFTWTISWDATGVTGEILVYGNR